MPFPAALAIDLWDGTGAGGLPAALRTFAALRVHGRGVVTGHGGPEGDAERIADAIAEAAATAGAVVLGATGGAAALAAAAGALASLGLPLVWHPGGAAAARDALPVLGPCVSVLTANLDEAAALTGTPRAATFGALIAQGETLLTAGMAYLVLTGGRGSGAQATDILMSPGGEPLRVSAPRIEGPPAAGRGATFAAAIAAHAAHRLELYEAVQLARLFTQGAIAAAGANGGAAHQFHRLWPAPEPEPSPEAWEAEAPFE